MRFNVGTVTMRKMSFRQSWRNDSYFVGRHFYLSVIVRKFSECGNRAAKLAADQSDGYCAAPFSGWFAMCFGGEAECLCQSTKMSVHGLTFSIPADQRVSTLCVEGRQSISRRSLWISIRPENG